METMHCSSNTRNGKDGSNHESHLEVNATSLSSSIHQMILLEFKAKRLRLLLKDRSTTERNFILPSEVKQKTSNYSNLNLSVRKKRFKLPETEPRLANRTVDAPDSQSTSSINSLPSSSSTPPYLPSSPSIPAAAATTITPSTRTESLLDKAFMGDETATSEPARPDTYQSSLVDANIARMRRKIKAKERYVASHDLPNPRSSSVSWAKDQFYEVPPMSPNQSQDGNVVDSESSNGGSPPALRQDPNIVEISLSSRSFHRRSLLHCRQRLILQQIRRLGRQRVLLHAGQAACPESLIRPSQIIREWKSSRVVSVQPKSDVIDGSKTPSILDAQEEVPFDQMSDESETRTRTDLLNRTLCAIATTKAGLRHRDQSHRSMKLGTKWEREGTNVVHDEDANFNHTKGSGNDFALATIKQQEVLEVKGEEPSEQSKAPTYVPRAPLGWQNDSRTNQDAIFDVWSSGGGKSHEFPFTSHVGDFASRSAADNKDDFVGPLGDLPALTSDVSVMTPRQNSVSFAGDSHPRRQEPVDQEHLHKLSTRRIDESIPVTTPQSDRGIKKLINMWKKLHGWKNRRVPFICGSDKSSRNTPTASKAYSASSDIQSSSTATESRSSQLGRKSDGVRFVTTPVQGESTTGKSIKEQLGLVMCVLHDKENSDWYVSQKMQETAPKQHDNSLMEMVFFD